jgi:hypothetical protein
MEKALDDKKTERDEAEKTLKEKEDKLKEAGDFKKNKAPVEFGRAGVPEKNKLLVWVG